jgi:hypothetical protein
MTGIILQLSKPVLSYTNADTQKESILNDNKSKAGIYC